MASSTAPDDDETFVLLQRLNTDESGGYSVYFLIPINRVTHDQLETMDYVCSRDVQNGKRLHKALGELHGWEENEWGKYWRDMSEGMSLPFTSIAHAFAYFVEEEGEQ